ncbi:CSEP0352 putative effector protein [Blumeria hordei DH14]|uniref:CSEP0352 putative effector protein n=1 Tax=Blumeria graminis f. sp. hordei (strain DH14) TaxID=546991 RepID=N1J8C4_BLUG1|nr:CSEP0352 putative effector protein [Blumeria hordei DH14]
MRFSKVAMILQGASLFVVTSASFMTAHVASESKVFNCLGRRFTVADFAEEKNRADRHIAEGNMISKASNIIEEEIRIDGEKNTILYSDAETTRFYYYQLRGHSYVENHNGYDRHVKHSILIDNLYRVSAMIIDEKWIARDGNVAANDKVIDKKPSFCSIDH